MVRVNEPHQNEMIHLFESLWTTATANDQDLTS